MGIVYPLIAVFLAAFFVVYLLYLALVKRNIREKMQTVVLPGFFFLSVWAAIYFIVF
ncbi:hypothetical protein LRS05_01310 [Flavobacterium sp. J372]|uniref:hypothetical protein n=1 Tax=Flavobacterium sp. J372 TaxID=2898436 RepID=UPI0021519C3F|nr:hypothetical protein [Flavobacterium sp. J372]MCR5860864.1 hypothetical protein [Flavobacterium sp. J372]